MNSFKVLALVCLVVAKTRSSPVPQPKPENDLFAGFLRNSQLGAPSKDSSIVKRRIFEDNRDRELKQISFSSLISDLESSLFASALSANKVVSDNAGKVEEINQPLDDQEHNINKRQLIALPAETNESNEPQERKVILQTSEKVAESGGVPAHYIIDRIAITPHTGSVPLIPTFEIQRTRSDNKTDDHEITKITISKTEITSLPNTPAPPTVAKTAEESLGAASTTPKNIEQLETTAPTTPKNIEQLQTTAPTTPKNIEQLKEDEEELKEKVAEIEAEPVILTARV